MVLEELSVRISVVLSVRILAPLSVMKVVLLSVTVSVLPSVLKLPLRSVGLSVLVLFRLFVVSNMLLIELLDEGFIVELSATISTIEYITG